MSSYARRGKKYLSESSALVLSPRRVESHMPKNPINGSSLHSSKGTVITSFVCSSSVARLGERLVVFGAQGEQSVALMRLIVQAQSPKEQSKLYTAFFKLPKEDKANRPRFAL